MVSKLFDRPVIEAIGLRKTYRKGNVEAVRGIDLVVPAGVCFALLGPNGAGKSTTLEMLQGLMQPTSGTLRIFGLGYRDCEREIRQRIGGILQDTEFYGKTKVSELLELFASLYAEPSEVSEVASSLGLNEILGRFIQDLSGGQRQRAFLGTALIGKPELIFLDEPTTGLDPAARHDFWATIRELKAAGTTIVLSTHYMEEAEALADQLVIIDGGKVIESGKPVEIIERVMQGREIPLRPRRATLNDVFLTLTGKPLELEPEMQGAA